MNKVKNILLLIGILLGFSSCNDFLSEKPDKSTSLVPTTVEQLNYLFNEYDSFYEEEARATYLSADTYGLFTELEDASAGVFGIANVEFATWDKEYLVNDGRENYFSSEYEKIFIANMVLSYIPKVTGTQEEKVQLEKEAKFIRAYSLWNLAQTYCLPYTDANKGELGMTIKASVSFEELTARATLEETYASIEADLTEALKITNDMKIVNNKYTSWRANRAAVNGFAARYWLNRNDYTKALEYANIALASHSVLVNYNTDMKYSDNPSYATVNGKKIEIKFPYTHDNQSDMTDMLEWKEQMFFRMLYNGSWWYIPSKQLLALYDKTFDLRYKYHMVKNYSYDRGLVDPAYEYPGYVFFFKDRIPSGPTTAEMLLIKAECLARLDKVGEAMSAVNILRDARFDATAPASVKHLSALTKAEAIKKIIEEREREMPFTQRWNDIRRLNNNEDAGDDVGNLTRSFYKYTNSGLIKDGGPITYTLEKGSRRYAAPIHDSEIQSSNGAIQQNKY
ncbi:MAG: RagB/SusD family nutrient uptake outer membrane protein, partial [Bacteroidales bacterium]